MLQLICTIKRTIFKKVRTETSLKIYNTLVLSTFLYGSENWTLTPLQRRRIEVAEMKLLRPLAGYTLYDNKTNGPHTPRTTDYKHTRKDRRIQTELAFTLAKNATKTESLWNHTATDHKEGEQLEDRRSVDTNSCNSGDGTDQRVQSLMFVMLIIIKCYSRKSQLTSFFNQSPPCWRKDSSYWKLVLLWKSWFEFHVYILFHLLSCYPLFTSM